MLEVMLGTHLLDAPGLHHDPAGTRRTPKITPNSMRKHLEFKENSSESRLDWICLCDLGEKYSQIPKFIKSPSLIALSRPELLGLIRVPCQQGGGHLNDDLTEPLIMWV